MWCVLSFLVCRVWRVCGSVAERVWLPQVPWLGLCPSHGVRVGCSRPAALCFFVSGFLVCRVWRVCGSVAERVWLPHVPWLGWCPSHGVRVGCSRPAVLCFFVSGFLVCRAWCVCVCACVGFVFLLLFCFVLFDLQSMQTAGLLLK